MFRSLVLTLLSLLFIHPCQSLAGPLPEPRPDNPHKSLVASVTPLHQFPLGSVIENIAVRRNGRLLLTRIDVPQLWEIDPFSPSTSYNPTLVFTFPDAAGLTGIAEIAPDVFAVAAGVPLNPAGTFSIWKVSIDAQGTATGTRVTSIPEAVALNGMALLSSSGGGTILVGDHVQGLVYRVDMANGDHSVAIQDPSMNPTDQLPIGVNGLEVQQGHLFFSNSAQGTLCKIPIDLSTGAATGPVKVITNNLFGTDDFALDTGTPYVAFHLHHELVLVRPNGEIKVLAGDPQSSVLPGPTSAAFGRTASDADTIYVTTSGAQFVPINGTYTEGAKVVAVVLNK